MVGGKSSAEIIIWTKVLLENFARAKKSLTDVQTIHVPRPGDILHTYSDFSQTHKAVGGRLEIHRPSSDGSVKTLLGGHYSCRVNKHQKNWFPCEGEALAARLVIEQFAPILESRNFKQFTMLITCRLCKPGKEAKEEHFQVQQKSQPFSPE